MPTLNEQYGIPDASSSNVFEVLAYLLWTVRHSLEEPDARRSERWVRIARSRQAQGNAAERVIATGVQAAVDQFADLASVLRELTLDLVEALTQTDALAAVLEVHVDLSIASLEALQNTPLVQQDATLRDGLSQLIAALRNVSSEQGVIPSPDDLQDIGHQLFRMLCIVQHPLTADPADPTALPPLHQRDHVVLAESGKLQLLQWAFGASLRTRGLGADEQQTVTLQRLGTRRLEANASLAEITEGRWIAGDRDDQIFEFDHANAAEPTRDIVEAHQLLSAMGYPTGPDTSLAALGPRLRRFQHVNRLPVHGRLDNHTLNRLMHLDFAARNVRRALPYPAAGVTVEATEETIPLLLANPNAERTPAEPALHREVGANRYSWYEVGSTFAAGSTQADAAQAGGWLAESTGNAGRFRALQSRRIVRKREGTTTGLVYDYHPDLGRYELSQGEAASGEFFFAAHSVDPWLAGRSGQPQVTPLPPTLTTNDVSRLYQWIDLLPLTQDARYGTVPLTLRASVLQRSLLGEQGGVDQGRIVLELYDDTEWLDTDGNPPATIHRGIKRPTMAAGSTSPRVAQTASAWWPDPSAHTAGEAASLSEKRTWTRRSVTLDVSSTSPPRAALVMIEGRSGNPNGFNIDAYFDNVELLARFRPAGS